MPEIYGKCGAFMGVRRLSAGPLRGSGCRTSSIAQNFIGGKVMSIRSISDSKKDDSYFTEPTDIVTGSKAWIGRGLSCVCAQKRVNGARLLLHLTPSQEDCLHRLQSRINVSYDSSKKDHQEALRALWSTAYPGVELHGLISDQWKEMGWQGKDPSTDLRGGGYISLENLLFFAKNYPDLLQKHDGVRAMWEYPFAVAGVNITYMLIQMFDLHAAKPRSVIGAIFVKLFEESERAFDILYCITFKLLDHQWLSMHASYMDFNMVLKSTRQHLEQELLLDDIHRIEDIPSYRFLRR